MVSKEKEDDYISSEENDDDVAIDSDEEVLIFSFHIFCCWIMSLLQLQEAFAAGLLKPGLNTIVEPKETSRPKTNDVEGLKQKLVELQTNMPWIERLDMVNKPAPLAPELGTPNFY